MRFHASAFAVVLAASSTEAFHVAPSRVASSRSFNTNPSFGIASQPLQQQYPTALSLAPGGGPEQLQSFIQLTEPVSKTSKVKNPKLAKLAGVAALPLSYIVGAAITPTRYLAAKAVVGAVAAATAGGVGKSAVEEDVRNACPTAIASRLLELGVNGPNVADGIDRLKEDYGVEDEDFIAMKIEIYSQYLMGMAKNPLTKTAELKELTQLREALRLNNAQVGQAHADAAVYLDMEISRTTSRWELDDPDHPDRKSIDKLLFLSERAFVQGGETEEAKTFELSRVVNYIHVPMDEVKGRIRSVSSPFYERALKSTREKLESGAVSSEMLEKARKTLGISDEDARDMSVDAFDEEVRLQLGLPEQDWDGYDMDDGYDMNRRISTDGEGKELLYKMLNTREEERKEEMNEMTVEDTRDVKFKEGAFEHVSGPVFLLVLQFTIEVGPPVDVIILISN